MAAIAETIPRIAGNDAAIVKPRYLSRGGRATNDQPKSLNRMTDSGRRPFDFVRPRL
jgi:hypothetical protein